LLLSVAIAIAAMPIAAAAGVPSVKNMMVTDVTTSSFSVIWASSEPSEPALEVYDDPDGVIPTAGAIVTPQPTAAGNSAIATLAEDNGVMKVRVTGLLPDTAYYFQTVTTSKDSSDTTRYPEDPPFESVITEITALRTRASGSSLVPFGNDVIVAECYLDDGVTPAQGTLLVATVEGGNYPVTAFVGDGIWPPYALLDLNNIFSRNSNESLDVAQGSNLALLNFRGALGNAVITHRVPEDGGLGEIKPPDPALYPGWNMVSFPLEPQDPSTTTVLAPIWDQFSSIWAYDTQLDKWKRYDRLGPPFLNDLNELHSLKGYWIVMDSDVSFKIEGDFPAGPIPIFTHWNLVGYSAIEPWGVPVAVNSITGILGCIWNYETDADKWKRYCPAGPPFLNDLQWVIPGKAYWIDATGDGSWE